MTGGITIEGISGNGPVDVNHDHQLLTKAITESEFEFSSDHDGLAFSWVSGAVDGGSGATILLIKNTSPTLELHIDIITIDVDTDSVVQIHLPTTEVTPTGGAVTGVVLNGRFSEAAPATAKSLETNNSQGDVIWGHELQAAGGPFPVPWGGALILRKNQSIAVDQVADVNAAGVTITGHFTAKPE